MLGVVRVRVVVLLIMCIYSYLCSSIIIYHAMRHSTDNIYDISTYRTSIKHG